MNLDKNKTYLLACSYGPDSMALFSMLLKEGYKFEAAFVNYHLREESNEEQKGFVGFCESKAIKYHILNVKDKPVGNVENWCRKLRYEFFNKIIADNKLDGLVVGHHQDDHLETYLLQKQRKTIVNCYGLQAKTSIFGIDAYRPLLNYSKKELLDYCHSHSIPYSIDKTNLENNYARNKIRHNIVEKLSKQERESLLKEIDDKNQELKKDLDYLSNIELEDINTLLRLNEQQYLIAINLLAKKVGSYSVSRKYCLELKAVLTNEKSNTVAPFRNNIQFVKTYGRCFFEKVHDVQYSFVLNEPGVIDTDYFYLDFTHEEENRNVHKDDYPITIRNIHLDDETVIKDYKVKANRLLIDWKVPLPLRKRWPVIVNNEGKVIYVPRYQKNFKLSKDINFYVK